MVYDGGAPRAVSPGKRWFCKRSGGRADFTPLSNQIGVGDEQSSPNPLAGGGKGFGVRFANR